MRLEEFLSATKKAESNRRRIICLKAPHGAGKSTLAQAILTYPIEIFGDGKLAIATYSRESNTLAIGQYSVGSMGCDGVKQTDEIKRLISLFWEKDVDILYEGILPSLAMSTYHDHSTSCGVRSGVLRSLWYVYINVPKQECIRRIQARRLQKYNMKPLNEDSVNEKYDRIVRSISYYRDRERLGLCHVLDLDGTGKATRVYNRYLTEMKGRAR